MPMAAPAIRLPPNRATDDPAPRSARPAASSSRRDDYPLGRPAPRRPLRKWCGKAEAADHRHVEHPMALDDRPSASRTWAGTGARLARAGRKVSATSSSAGTASAGRGDGAEVSRRELAALVLAGK
jgi:hypothetical protein